MRDQVSLDIIKWTPTNRIGFKEISLLIKEFTVLNHQIEKTDGILD